MKTMIAAVAALALAGSPVVAAANSASKLSVTQSLSKSARVGSTPRADANKLKGNLLIAALAAVAVIVGIIVASDGSKSP